VAGLHFSVHDEDFVHNRHLIDSYLPHLLPYLEADVYGCLSIVLDNLIRFNNITLGGIYAEDMVQRLKQLLPLVDSTLNFISYTQFPISPRSSSSSSHSISRYL
jgi:hypothetical protein